MCFGSINPRIDHGADQDPPSRIIEIHSFSDPNTASTLSYEGTMSSSSKEKKKPFHNEESNLPSYPSCTGTLGTVSRQKTKVVQKKNSFHREQEDLPVGWGWNNALSHGALDLSQTTANQRGRAIQKDLEEERKMKAEKKPKMRP